MFFSYTLEPPSFCSIFSFIHCSINSSFSLASNSPRRRQLIALGGWMFHVTPVNVDETPLQDETPDMYVTRLARAKALAAADTPPPRRHRRRRRHDRCRWQ
ncbi:MAG: Maf-like protein [Anaerolineae bacterium]|nr:Maf-like protein [Anaerolineae bacterium]